MTPKTLSPSTRGVRWIERWPGWGRIGRSTRWTTICFLDPCSNPCSGQSSSLSLPSQGAERPTAVHDRPGHEAHGSPDPDPPDASTGSDPPGRAWTLDAIACIEADARRSADTHLVTFPLPPARGIDLYLKDKSTHPTGSLKHRLARSLFLYRLGWINEGVTIIEASSGSTAVSEAYFAAHARPAVRCGRS